MQKFDVYSKIADMNEIANKEIISPSSIPHQKPINYESSVFSKMADNIKSPFQEQVEAVKVIAEASVSQANSARDISIAAQTHTELLQKQVDELQSMVETLKSELKIHKKEIASNSKSAKLSSYISFSALAISSIAIIVEIILHFI